MINWPRSYDLLTFIAFGGREGRARWRLAEGSGVKRDDRVLDIGCGTGSLTAALARIAGRGNVTGIDASASMIERASRKKGGEAVDYRVAFAQALPFDGASFDLVTSCLALHHIPESELARAFSEMRRVLTPGGRVYLLDFSARPEGVLGRVLTHLTHGGGDRRLERAAVQASEAGFASVSLAPTTHGTLTALVGVNPAAAALALSR